MRLAVIADTTHYVDSSGRLLALAPVVAQIDRMGGLVDELVICAPLHGADAPASFVEYQTPRLTFVPLRPGGGATFRAKLGLIPRSVGWWRTTRRVARRSDALHFRCPSNVGAVGLIATWCFRRDRYAMYAGSWTGYDREPLTYRAQRWLLRRRSFRGFVTVYGKQPGDPPHVVDFYSPSYSDGDWLAEADAVANKVERLNRVTQLRPVRIVSVGALTADKGHGLVIDALALLRRRGIDASLSIVGGGPERSALEQRAAARGVADHVEFCGHSTMPAVRLAFRRADIAVLASRTEGYPKVVIEAMVGGAVPVVSTFAASKSLTGDGKRGLAVDRTGDAVAAAIETLTNDPHRMSVMVKAGREFSRLRTLDSFERDLEAMFDARWRVRRGATVGLRVLQVVDTLAPGGRERLVVDLANGFDERGCESHVCETRASGPLAADLSPGVRRLALNRAARWDVVAMARMAAYVRRNGINVVHSHGRAVMQFVSVVKVVFRLPIVHVFHDHLGGVDVTTSAGASLRLPARIAVDGVIAVSQDLAAWARQRLRVPPDRVWFVPNAVSVERFQDSGATLDLCSEFGLSPNAPVLVSVANVREPKDYETLFRAVASLLRPVSLVVVGSEGNPVTRYALACRELVRDLGIGERIVFAGARSDVPAILAGSDLGVLSSLHESGPLAVAEYAAAGLPFVATATGDITLSLANESFAEVVPIGDSHAFAKAIEQFLSMDEDRRRCLGEQARACVTELFPIERVLDRTCDVYASLLGQISGGSAK